MQLSADEQSRFQDRAGSPHYYAALDIAELHNLKRGSAEYKAFNCLWCANGKWQTLERIFKGPDIDRKLFSREAELILFDEENRPGLQNMIDQTKALCRLYKVESNVTH